MYRSQSYSVCHSRISCFIQRLHSVKKHLTIIHKIDEQLFSKITAVPLKIATAFCCYFLAKIAFSVFVIPSVHKGGWAVQAQLRIDLGITLDGAGVWDGVSRYPLQATSAGTLLRGQLGVTPFFSRP